MKVMIALVVFLSTVFAGANESALREAIAEYPVIVYVNKSVRSRMGQRIVVFHEGRQILTDHVSTGREQFEAERFSTTPTGFFTPTFLSENHVASKSGIPMPFSVFFHENIALHQAVNDNRGTYQLGRRASAGCVRLSERLAPQLFDLIKETGKGRMPIIHEDGTVAISADGEMYRMNRYMTLIVVDDSTADRPLLLEKIRGALR